MNALSVATTLVVAVAVGAIGGVLPETLREHAGTVGCSEIEHFYDRPGRIDPAHVFGVAEPEEDPFGEQSAVYWCQRIEESEPYLLVVWLVAGARTAKIAACPATISWQNYPGGLTLWRDEKVSLSNFWYRDNPQQHGPPDVVTDGPIIHSEYDGAGADFYCHDGTWLARQFH